MKYPVEVHFLAKLQACDYNFSNSASFRSSILDEVASLILKLNNNILRESSKAASDLWE